MGKRRHPTGDVAGEGKRPRKLAAAGHKKEKKKKKNLYLALDDWDKGFSIHKVDVDEDVSLDSDDAPAAEALPTPPVVRLEAPRGINDALFGASGSNILALWQPRNRQIRAVAYDTGTGGLLAEGPAHPAGLQPMRFVATGGGGRLHALHARGLHCLDLFDEDQDADLEYGRLWRWTRGCSSLRLPFLTDDGTPAPWGPIEIAAYAVHPDGNTVFVSAFGILQRCFGTFSLDTAAASSSRPAEWRRHGEWLLPFRGQGHYDSTLDAWVGLHSPGYVCACDVPPTGTGTGGEGERPRPGWELVKADGLFTSDPEDRFLDKSFITLASMGDAEFCILEPLTTKGGEMTLQLDTGDEYVLHVTKFRLQRARHGQLQTSSRHIARSAYRVRKYNRYFVPQAFCMHSSTN